jgi:hypothetical protein
MKVCISCLPFPCFPNAMSSFTPPITLSGPSHKSRSDSSFLLILTFASSTSLIQIGIQTIILMGHSTGSQNVIHYLSSPLPPVQGGIMQAPCSDRQYFEKDERERLAEGKGPSEVFSKIEEGWKAIEEGRGGEILVGITGRRLVDLCAVG